MTSKWVDFKTVREKLDFVDVLSHYGIKTHGRGKQVKIICPFHDDHKPSCGVNLAKQVYNCFACGAGGNALDFVAHMEELDPNDTTELRKAALLASDIFNIEEATIKPKATKSKASSKKAKNGSKKVTKASKSETQRKGKAKPSEANSRPSEQSEPAPAKPVNKPLSFELKLERKHPFIKARGFGKKLVKEFGIGFANKGIMAERICFPIHNEDGELIAYSGRWASDSLPDDVPRYLLPKGFEKSKVLFNLNQAIGMREAHTDLDTVVIVEGFWSVMRLHDEGIPCVSTFGDSVSKDQVELLVQNGFRKAILIYDGDEGGRTGTEQSLPLLAESLFTLVVYLDDGVKPDTMDNQLVSALHRYF